MIPFTYNRKNGIMTTPCPFGQRVKGVLSLKFGEGDEVAVNSTACHRCPEFIAETGDGVKCRKEK